MVTVRVVKVRANELVGPALDYAVAKAVGHPLCCEAIQENYIIIGHGNGDLERFSPSTDWEHGGPLIEKYQAFLEKFPQSQWLAKAYDAEWCRGKAEGATPLIAVCRAVVVLKLGNNVEIPEELKP